MIGRGPDQGYRRCDAEIKATGAACADHAAAADWPSPWPRPEAGSSLAASPYSTLPADEQRRLRQLRGEQDPPYAQAHAWEPVRAQREALDLVMQVEVKGAMLFFIFQ